MHKSKKPSRNLAPPAAANRLPAARAHITAIRHDGAAITGHQFGRMLKVAAERIASELFRESLALDAAEIKDRFGFSA